MDNNPLNHMIRYKTLSIDEVLPYIVDDKRVKHEFYGYNVKVGTDRLNVFKKELSCVCCGKKGSYFAIERHQVQVTPHLNLYSEDNILMTKDHIVPKSKGGKDIIENYQTMCAVCNEKKGDNFTERKLASIQKIYKLEPIENADRIELASILGWQCVVKKGEFKEGDLCVFFEIDSVLPEKPVFEFMRERKFRVKTAKFRKCISQGLAMPIKDVLGEGNWKEGLDVTDIIGVTKYLSPSEKAEEERILDCKNNRVKKFLLRYSFFRRFLLSRKQKSGYPFWINKTDEPRIQGIPQVLEQFKNKDVYVTEKIDYQNVSFTGLMVNRFPILGKLSPKKYKFVVCSRNFTTGDKNSLYWRIAKKYNIEDILKQNPNITIQGEQGDTKVQGNKYGLKDIRLWVFNVIDHKRNYQYNFEEMYKFCEKYGLETVPLVHVCKLSELGSTVEKLVEYSKARSVIADIPREGIVVRCIENGQKMVSFKVINPDFLLKYDC